MWSMIRGGAVGTARRWCRRYNYHKPLRILYVTKSWNDGCHPSEGTGSNSGVVVGVDFNLNNLSTIVSGLRLGSRGSSVLASQDGSVIAHSDFEAVVPESVDGQRTNLRQMRIDELPNPGLTEALAVFNEQGLNRQTLNVDGVTWEFAFATIPLGDGNGFTLGLTAEQTDLMSQAYELLRTGGIFFIIVLLCSTVAIILVAQFLSRPIRQLQRNTEGCHAL